MLQTRSAKRPAQAAVRFAVDAVDEGLLTKARGDRDDRRRRARRAAASRVRPGGRLRRARPRRRRLARAPRRARSCSPPRTPSTAARRGPDVILVRPFTEAEDVAGFHAASGILTSRAARPRTPRSSRAGWAARRSPGPPSSTSTCTPAEVRVGGLVLHEGDLIAIDGSAGTVTTDDVPLVEAASTSTSRRCCAGATSCVHSACAPTPTPRRTPRRAPAFGAEGIGLCRTEHMFMAADRQPKMRAMIMAEDDDGRRAALDELLPLQQARLRGAVRGDGRPAGHDPAARPAAARVPARPLRAARADRARRGSRQDPRLASSSTSSSGSAASRRRTRCSVRAACGSGCCTPRSTRCRCAAIVRAARAVASRRGQAPKLEIMIPLVAYERELEIARARVLDGRRARRASPTATTSPSGR